MLDLLYQEAWAHASWYQVLKVENPFLLDFFFLHSSDTSNNHYCLFLKIYIFLTAFL